MSKKKRSSSIESYIGNYSDHKVSPQVLNGIADDLCSRYIFLNIEGETLYIYDRDCYRLFTNTYAGRFIEMYLKSMEFDHALRSADHKEIVRLLKNKVDICAQGDCRTNVYRILFSDGVFDIRDRKMHRPCKEDYMFSKIEFPLDWEKEHRPDQAARDFIQRFCGDDAENEDYLWELIGYLLSGFQKKILVAFWGPSNSGKSTLANMVRRICGSSSCVALGIKDLGTEFGLAELQGKKLCIDSDMDATVLNARDISILKKVTGNDLLLGNRKYEQPFYFQCQAKLLLCMNNKIRFKGNDEDTKAIQDRIRAFELRHSISVEEQRCDMDMILDANRPYFLHKAMEGLCRLYDNDFRFTCEGSGSICAENINGISHSVGIREFLKTRCAYGNGYRETVADLFRAYESFMDENGWDPTHKKEFSRFLVDKCGFTRERTKEERFIRGIRLLKR